MKEIEGVRHVRESEVSWIVMKFKKRKKRCKRRKGD